MTVSKINQLYFKVITTMRYNDKIKRGSAREGGVRVQFSIELGYILLGGRHLREDVMDASIMESLPSGENDKCRDPEMEACDWSRVNEGSRE